MKKIVLARKDEMMLKDIKIYCRAFVTGVTWYVVCDYALCLAKLLIKPSWLNILLCSWLLFPSII
jgi:hypothetical protein